MKDENAPNPLLRTGKIILDFFEVYIPAVSFLIIFAVFLIQVFCRYFLTPQTWTFDVTMSLYIYAIMFGACYALREDEHINFSMIYDACSPRKKLIMQMVGNLIVIAIFVFAMPSCFHYSWTIITAQIKKTSVLYIPYKYLYSPMLFLMVDSVVRLLVGVIHDIKALAAGGKEKEV